MSLSHTEILRAPLLQTGLVERVLARLGLNEPPEPTLEGLRELYAAWCGRVPFENVRKIIHVRGELAGVLPGSSAEDYLEAWLQFGTGGTCWPGAGALHALLRSLGFVSARVMATMMAAPNLPPNHGSVRVSFGEQRYLVDTSMLHGVPLLLDPEAPTVISHPAWGLRCARREDRWHVSWRPLHKTDGFDCRLERFGVSGHDYHRSYNQTRSWSPFNYEVSARKNRGNEVVGVAFGHSVILRADGTVTREPLTLESRNKFLIEQLELSEEIVARLPVDVATPPPPWSRTAASPGPG